MVQATELGYMGLGVKNLEAWKDFATAILGMELTNEGERDRCYLRMDYWHHRLVLHNDSSDDLAYLGFRVANAEDFQDMQRQLFDAGIQYRVGSAEEAVERHVLEVLKLQDPDGTPIEIFHGPEIQASKPFHPGRRMHGRFKTGAGGLGHCIIRQKDVDAAYRFFYLLGLRGGIEYKIQMGKRTVTPVFMHCNERQHTVAFGIAGPERRINHLMIQVENFDDVGLTYELVRKNKIPVHILPGKHSNDHMFSFYFRNPSGWMIEYGWGGRAPSAQSEYYTEDIFGHQPEDGGFGGER
ncbi:MAG: VOC family protein [Candidatus Binatia bacterium]